MSFLSEVTGVFYLTFMQPANNYLDFSTRLSETFRRLDGLHGPIH